MLALLFGASSCSEDSHSETGPRGYHLVPQDFTGLAFLDRPTHAYIYFRGSLASESEVDLTAASEISNEELGELSAGALFENGRLVGYISNPTQYLLTSITISIEGTDPQAIPPHVYREVLRVPLICPPDSTTDFDVGIPGQFWARSNTWDVLSAHGFRP